jgi:hypothetical protein
MEANKTPIIELNIYDPENDELKFKLTRSFIPYGMLKAAIQLSKKLEGIDINNPDEILVDEMAAFVCEVFNGKVTVDELMNGTDVEEMITVIMTILGRARKLMPENPTLPAKPRKRH